ncbi:MAG TPA: cytochrome c peroxidase [Niastella sp.]
MLHTKSKLIIGGVVAICLAAFSFTEKKETNAYMAGYNEQLLRFKQSQEKLLQVIEQSDLQQPTDIAKIKARLQASRNYLKCLDFWFRYLEPTVYKMINGPLPVEWETEVFEKFEKPYKRNGAGLTLAALYLEEDSIIKDSLAQLIKSALSATETFAADSITTSFSSYHHFYLCNRLFLLNLAAIYTTGFECPDTSKIIPELRLMMGNVAATYQAYNNSFPATPLPDIYLTRFNEAVAFVNSQPGNYSAFDHFSFIKDYINPLFLLNQQLINQYHVVSKSLIDYSLNKKEIPIFNKSLYNGQNSKGIFLRVSDPEALASINRLGRLLFYDPILSGNNLRSCASCHKPDEFFTDTAYTSSLQFNRKDFLPRNTPSLINAPFNHLLMLDGKHISLQNQTKDVITNPLELSCTEREVMEKVMSCNEYKNGFKALLKYTPQEKEISFEHITSAITSYYSGFSNYYSPFDEAMNNNKQLDAGAMKGFNLFMSKAQCATCHFVPQFNGVKPPYIGSEFEVIGVPKDTAFEHLSHDAGRYEINPATETNHAFRTGTIRNAAHTAPYMHNGVFASLSQVIDFYNNGGGAGRKLQVDNQTLSPDPLQLTMEEKNNLLHFIQSLNEDIVFDTPPQQLPVSKIKALNSRKPGGDY